MAELTLVEAVNDALHTELARDADVMVLGDDLEASMRSEAAELMRAGIAEAEAEPDADLSLLFDRAYANPPASFAHDLAELRRILGGGVG